MRTLGSSTRRTTTVLRAGSSISCFSNPSREDVDKLACRFREDMVARRRSRTKVVRHNRADLVAHRCGCKQHVVARCGLSDVVASRRCRYTKVNSRSRLLLQGTATVVSSSMRCDRTAAGPSTS